MAGRISVVKEQGTKKKAAPRMTQRPRSQECLSTSRARRLRLLGRGGVRCYLLDPRDHFAARWVGTGPHQAVSTRLGCIQRAWPSLVKGIPVAGVS